MKEEDLSYVSCVGLISDAAREDLWCEGRDWEEEEGGDKTGTLRLP